MVCNSCNSLSCSYLAGAAGAHLHTSEGDEERQHLGYRHWGRGQHSPAVTKNCHNTGEPKKKRWWPFFAVMLLIHHFLYANAVSRISRWVFVFNSIQTKAQKYVFCWSWKSLNIAWWTGLFEAERAFCVLLIAARMGDEVLLLLSFHPVRVPGWALSCLPLEYAQHQGLYIVSVAAVVF